MTEYKAKMYRTAQVVDRNVPIPDGFKPGDFVAVMYLGVGSFGERLFQCRKADGTVAAIGEYSLDRFCL